MSHWTKKPIVNIIERMIDETIAWSVTSSALIAAGEDANGGNGSIANGAHYE